VEYMSTHVDDDRQAYKSTFVIPQIEGGYRWVWGSFLMDVGAGVGYAINTAKTTERLPGVSSSSTLYANTAEDAVYGLAMLDIGFFF
jgi:hypothetical protein